MKNIRDSFEQMQLNSVVQRTCSVDAIIESYKRLQREDGAGVVSAAIML